MTMSNGLHILVATSGSTHAAAVSDFLLRLVPQHGAGRITIIAVINEIPVFAGIGEDGYTYASAAYEMAEWEQVRSTAQSDAQAATYDLERTLADRAGIVTSRVAAGRPGEEIVRAAVEGQADLIVVGSHDHGLLYSTVFGSVSEYVIHHAHRPVLVVPRVAVPVDMPERSDQRSPTLAGQPTEGLAPSTI